MRETAPISVFFDVSRGGEEKSTLRWQKLLRLALFWEERKKKQNLFSSLHFSKLKSAVWHLKCLCLCVANGCKLELRQSIIMGGTVQEYVFCAALLPVADPFSLPSAFRSSGNTCAGLTGARWCVITHYATNWLPTCWNWCSFILLSQVWHWLREAPIILFQIKT